MPIKRDKEGVIIEITLTDDEEEELDHDHDHDHDRDHDRDHDHDQDHDQDHDLDHDRDPLRHILSDKDANQTRQGGGDH